MPERKTYAQLLDQFGDVRLAQIAWLQTHDSIPPWVGDHDAATTRQSEEARLGMNAKPPREMIWRCPVCKWIWSAEEYEAGKDHWNGANEICMGVPDSFVLVDPADVEDAWTYQAVAEIPMWLMIKHAPPEDAQLNWTPIMVINHGERGPKLDQVKLPFVTATGKVLTDEDIKKLADEAEAGYDVERLAIIRLHTDTRITRRPTPTEEAVKRGAEILGDRLKDINPDA